MPAILDACFFCDDVPNIYFKDGLFHVCVEIGAYRFERVMAPNVFFKSVAAGQEAIRQYRETGSAEIIPIEFDSKFERVYPADKSA
jgi:hypothetical protein